MGFSNAHVSPYTLSLLVVGATVLYIFGFCIYRLTLHPFARYPGPALAKISSLYSLYHAYKQDMHIDLWRCHQRYGDFVRYAPDRLSINRVDAIKDIYGHGKNLRKGKAYAAWPVHPGAFNVHNAVDKTIHGRKRRVISQGFSDVAIKSAEPFMLTHIRDLTLRLLDAKNATPETVSKSKTGGWSTPKDMARYCERTILDMLTDLAFGKSFDTLTQPDNRFAINAIIKHLHRQSLAMTYPELFHSGSRSWLSIDTWLLPEFARLRARYVSLGKEVATQTIASLEKSSEAATRKRKDILYYIINASDPETGSKFTLAEIFSEANVLLSAGGDTTSLALAAILFYLSRSPSSHEKVIDEIRNSFPDLSSVRSGPTLSSLIYLRACVDESMRMSPAIGSVLWREVQEGGAMISEDHILVPAGYEVGTPTYALHHNQKVWGHDSFVFRPERWISSPGNPVDRIKEAAKAFTPFSIGPRGCLAKPLAYQQLTLIVARLLYVLDFKLADGPEWANLGEGGPEGWGTGGWGGDGCSKKMEKQGLEWGRHREGEFQLYDQFTAAKVGPGLVWKIREGLQTEEVFAPLLA